MPRTATAETLPITPANGHGPKARKPYPVKTIGCRPATQAALDELRGRLATAGQGVRSETAVIAEAQLFGARARQERTPKPSIEHR